MGGRKALDGTKLWNELVAFFVLPMLRCQGLDAVTVESKKSALGFQKVLTNEATFLVSSMAVSNAPGISMVVIVSCAQCKKVDTANYFTDYTGLHTISLLPECKRT